MNKKRNAKKTADQILKAAQQLFQSNGYSGTSTREIADLAGINAALISRYFGSKKQLFEQAVLPYLTIDYALESGSESLPQRLARYFSSTMPKDRFDPMVALIRSIGDVEVAPLLTQAIKTNIILVLSKFFNAKDAELRATLVATQAAGLILWIRVMEGNEYDEAQRQKLYMHLEQYFTLLFDHDA